MMPLTVAGAGQAPNDRQRQTRQACDMAGISGSATTSVQVTEGAAMCVHDPILKGLKGIGVQAAFGGVGEVRPA
jgi:hypothetical protein